MLANSGYIMDGLVLWLDAIDKGNITGAWVDRAAGHIFAASGNVAFGTNYIQLDGSSWLSSSETFNLPSPENGTIEVALSDFLANNNMLIYMPPDNTGKIAFGLLSGKGVIWSASAGYMAPVALTSGFKTASVTKDLFVADGDAGTFDISDTRYWSGISNTSYIGGRASGSYFTGKVHAIRIYNRHLTPAEMLQNQRLDNKRYNLGLTI